MKKIPVLLLSVILSLLVWGCAANDAGAPTEMAGTQPPTPSEKTECSHNWEGAECGGTQTCSACGEERTAMAQHDWQGNKCDEPLVCANCGKEGVILEHSFSQSDCQTAAVCERCGENGELGDHKFSTPTCTEPGTCSICDAEKPAMGHAKKNATCTSPISCTRCDYTEGEPLGHDGSGRCTRCGEALPIEGSGSGDAVVSGIELDDDAFYILHMTHSGYSNFIVHAYGADGDKDLLVNEIGNYSGVILIDSESPIMLNVEADGKWTYNILELASFDISDFSGKGDWVTCIFPAPDGAQSWHFKHNGDSNFVVWLWTTDGRDLVINEIGAYDADQVITIPEGSSAFFEIKADGEWAIYPS